MKRHAVKVDTVMTERVHVPVAHLRPIDKLDAKLEGRVGMAHEVAFIESNFAVEVVNSRNRCLADTDDANCIRLDELDLADLLPEYRR